MAKSLAAQSSSTSVALDFPVEFDSHPIDVVSTKVTSPYVLFAQPKAIEQWMELATKIPGLQEGDQVLVQPEPSRPQKINPLRFSVVRAKQYWLKKDKSGKRVEGVKPSMVQMPRGDGWKEEIFAAIVAYVARDAGVVEAVPCTITFKTTKCPACIGVTLQVKEAERPEWADNSPAHKMAFAAMAKPWLRVVGTVQTANRSGDNAYVAAKSIVSPSTPSEWQAIKALLEDQGDPSVNRKSGMDRLREVAKHFETRMTEMGVPL